MVQNARARNRLHKDAFKAVHIWANSPALKRFIVSYEPYSKREGSRFHCTMATPFSLDSMIGWPENGVYLDSSWRHKNDANLPLTLMVTSRNPGKDEGIPGEEILRTLKDYQESGVPGHM